VCLAASKWADVLGPGKHGCTMGGMPLCTAAGAACPDSEVAIEIRLADGRRDLLIAADPEREGAQAVAQDDWGVRTDAELCAVRLDGEGRVERIALCQGREVALGNTTVRLKAKADLIEVVFDQGRAMIESGSAEAVEAIILDGAECEWRAR